jgi:hypothetical protein
MQKPTRAIPLIPIAVDASLALPDSLADLAFGQRTIFLFKPEGEVQYLVYKPGFSALNDPDASHVLGSGFSLEHAALSACGALALQSTKPSAFWARLEGCSFTTAIEHGNIALQHVCLDPEGRELGRADHRRLAAELALHRALVGANDVTFEEFCAIASPVRLDPGGRGTYGSTYADEISQNLSLSMLGHMYRACPEVRAGAKAMAPESTGEALKTLQGAFQREMLGALSRTSDVTSFRVSAEQGEWEGYLVLHTPRISSDRAMRVAFENYLAERCAEAPESLAER